jgi:glyoxylase-like metal-dependent hydrolase (beta-lactamase superfamily II)
MKRAANFRPAILILSHADNDHIGGFREFVTALRIHGPWKPMRRRWPLRDCSVKEVDYSRFIRLASCSQRISNTINSVADLVDVGRFALDGDHVALLQEAGLNGGA